MIPRGGLKSAGGAVICCPSRTGSADRGRYGKVQFQSAEGGVQDDIDVYHIYIYIYIHTYTYTYIYIHIHVELYIRWHFVCK